MKPDDKPTLLVENKYPEWELQPLESLIETRTKKVEELIATDKAIVANGSFQERSIRRINEYSSVANYLRELAWYKKNFELAAVKIKDMEDSE